MPAYPTHTLFSHLALLALVDARHPLAGSAWRHQGMFRVAGIAGCDIQCMPYQVCGRCEAPYRHNQGGNKTCLVCGEVALADFTLSLPDGRVLKRADIERDYYRNTHLVLGRRPFPYGTPLDAPSGPPEQPFPEQVVRHLANMLRDAGKLSGPRGQASHFVAFTLGWFSHVVSDAIFKGVYPQSVRVKFFGHQYHMSMLPAAEAITLTDLSYDFGVAWPLWHEELLRDAPDGGALRHLAMGNQADQYDPAYWTPEFGKPDPRIGTIMDAVPPINRVWFHRMYLNPDYSAASPRLDARKMEDRANWTFDRKHLGQLRRYAIQTGWYEAFIKGVEIYLRVVNEAAAMAGFTRDTVPSHLDFPIQSNPGFAGWAVWRSTIEKAAARPELSEEWGSRLDINPSAERELRSATTRSIHLLLPPAPTDYQRKMAVFLASKFKSDPKSETRLFIGPPVFNPQTMPFLCREDTLRLKYGAGLSSFITSDPESNAIYLAGLSDFGDWQLLQWLQAHL